MRRTPPLGRAGVMMIAGISSMVAMGFSTRAAVPDPSEAEQFFEARVRPVLVDRCVSCHGPDKQSSGLRLDSRASALKGGDYGEAVVPGDVEASLLIGAVAHTDDFLKMPPKGDKLAEDVVRDLTAWVEMGAPWPEPAAGEPSPTTAPNSGQTHWAFQPVRKVAPPTVRDSSWTVNPIDAFVLARLESTGLAPSPIADRHTLIRRVTFDLTGLPPTPEEIAAFEADESPDAYARVVDRLLASPRYGERWGRHWLDVARYSDTKGYVFQEERRYPYAYTYRDYVIRAFNQDKPFDRFVVEQLAADLLPDDPGGTDKLAAMGFLTVGRRFLNRQDDIIDDRIDVTTRGLLGLTVACARCHDHKYDPIPAEDYYSLYGVFASSEEPDDLPLLAGDGAAGGSESYRAEHQKRLDEVARYITDKRAEFRKELTDRLADYLAAAVAIELNPRHNRLDAVARDDSLRPELLRHLASRWKGLIDNTGTVADPLLGPWQALAALPADDTFAIRAAEITDSLEDENASGPADPLRAAVIHAIAGDAPADSMAEVARRYGALLSRALAEPDNADLGPIRDRLESPESPLTIPEGPDQFRRLVNRAERARLSALNRKVAELDATHPGAPPRAMVMVDKPQPYNPYVFLRGNSGRRGDNVPRRFLKVLSGPDRKPFGEGSGRLELARAIASPDNPLTARVIVNRVWMHHFGRALVDTPSDFGLRSDPPTHPELLDWLAATFVEEGWSLKTLHRRILLSNTYQQQSLDRSECLSVDPENNLIWKQNRQRLELEPLRDAMLAVADRLDATMGGRSVDIVDPPFSTRRTVYAFIDRQNLPGLFRTFDLASPNASSPRRYETTVPQQSLFLMNSPFVADQARHLAARAGRDNTGTSEGKVQALYRALFGRAAEPHEVEAALRFVSDRESAPGPDVVTNWRYGYGRFDEETGRVTAFAEFPHWNGKAWQFGEKLPHPKFSYLHRHAKGGHVGQDADHAAIVRWVAPEDAVITITGSLGHKSDKGDGVRGRIVAGRGGSLGEWAVHNTDSPTDVERYEVAAEETIDFVVDCRGEASYDSYTWTPAIRVVENPSGLAVTKWNARDDFHGPLPPRLTPWQQYAQVLLLTNEFAYID